MRIQADLPRSLAAGKRGPLLAVLGVLLSCQANGAPPTVKQREFFESRIRPVLVERCYGCHNSADEAQGGLFEAEQ